MSAICSLQFSVLVSQSVNHWLYFTDLSFLPTNNYLLIYLHRKRLHRKRKWRNVKENQRRVNWQKFPGKMKKRTWCQKDRRKRWRKKKNVNNIGYYVLFNFDIFLSLLFLSCVTMYLTILLEMLSFCFHLIKFFTVFLKFMITFAF